MLVSILDFKYPCYRIILDFTKQSLISVFNATDRENYQKLTNKTNKKHIIYVDINFTCKLIKITH